MLKKVPIFPNFHFQRVKYKIQTFSSGKLGSGNEITVSGNEDYLIYLVFVGKGGYIHADFHINTFLADSHFKITLF